MITVHCDKCGSAIVGRGKRLILFGWRNGYRTDADQIDMCESCYRAAKAWLSGNGEARPDEAGELMEF